MKALIVDDEEHNRINLDLLLGEYAPEITETRLAGSADEAYSAYYEFKPNIIFLDISMPRKNGFVLLDDLKESEAEIIFVTAYDEYAIRAIKRSPAGYILKPIDVNELTESIGRAVSSIKKKEAVEKNYSNAIQSLKDELNGIEQEQAISLKVSSGFEFVKFKDVFYLEADGSYTLFHLEKEKVMVSHPLSYYQELLPSDFIRIHRSFLINKLNIKNYSSKKKSITMGNGTILPVSVRRAKEVNARFR